MLKGRLELETSGTDRRGHPAGCSGGGAAGQFGERAHEPTQAALTEQSTSETQPLQVQSLNSYHALKDQVLDLLYRDIPASTVIEKLMKLLRAVRASAS